jgi:hypothetical protein
MFEALALGGGGVRGGLLVGGLCALESLRGNLQFSRGIYGCSIGSILATAVAFNLPANTIRVMFEEDFQLSRAIPKIRLSNLTEFPSSKGLYSMDMFRDMLIETFEKHGIKLRDTMIQDAPQSLFILASNLTTRRPTFLTGNTSILDAILASCCLPFIFKPQIVFNNVYIDGGVFVRDFHTIVPKDCIVFHIDRPNNPLFPEDIQTTTVQDMFTSIYSIGHLKAWPSNVVVFENDTIQILQELSQDDKNLMYSQGYSRVFSFWSKLNSQELK